MCPPGTELLLITDQANLSKAQTYLHQKAPDLKARFLCVEDLSTGTHLNNAYSFNSMMKRADFWNALPHKELLIIHQTTRPFLLSVLLPGRTFPTKTTH